MITFTKHIENIMGKIIEKRTGLRMKKPGNDKYLCLDCLITGKGTNPCGVQGHKIVDVPHKIYFPSPTASKTRWKQFLNAIKAYGFVSTYNLREIVLSKVPLRR